MLWNYPKVRMGHINGVLAEHAFSWNQNQSTFHYLLKASGALLVMLQLGRLLGQQYAVQDITWLSRVHDMHLV